MKRFLAVAALSFALIGLGCQSSRRSSEDDGDSPAPGACTKCACREWSDPNGNGRCATLVDGRPCGHTRLDHISPSARTGESR